MTLTVALIKFFGKRENEGLAGFAVEVRALTEKDKTDFVKMLEPIFPGEDITI